MSKHRAPSKLKWRSSVAVVAMLAGSVTWAAHSGPADTPPPAPNAATAATPTPPAAPTVAAPPAAATPAPSKPAPPPSKPAPVAKPPAAPPNASKAAAVVSVALAQRGKPYVWAAEGPSAFDCSGLVVYAYRIGAGVTLPHFTGSLWSKGRVVTSRAALLPGDLIFPATSHVQIYIGNGQVVDAANPSEPVKVRPLGKYIRAVRIL